MNKGTYTAQYPYIEVKQDVTNNTLQEIALNELHLGVNTEPMQQMFHFRIEPEVAQQLATNLLVTELWKENLKLLKALFTKQQPLYSQPPQAALLSNVLTNVILHLNSDSQINMTLNIPFNGENEVRFS